MPTRYSTSDRTLSDTPTSEAQFPIYFCEGCGFKGAGFGVKRADGQMSYCGWVNGEPKCVGRGKGEAPAAAVASPPWE
jgi:hypothetical protein